MMNKTITNIDTTISHKDKDGKDIEETFIGIRMEVRGSEYIEFEEGSRTGDMTENGISINTQMHEGKLYGGCINREETKELRDFLNRCIDIWGNETK